jgi:hypothetical protein
MPKTAVDEQAHPRIPKYEIRLADQLLIPPPTRYFIGLEDLNYL